MTMKLILKYHKLYGLREKELNRTIEEGNDGFQWKAKLFREGCLRRVFEGHFYNFTPILTKLICQNNPFVLMVS